MSCILWPYPVFVNLDLILSKKLLSINLTPNDLTFKIKKKKEKDIFELEKKKKNKKKKKILKKCRKNKAVSKYFPRKKKN